MREKFFNRAIIRIACFCAFEDVTDRKQRERGAANSRRTKSRTASRIICRVVVGLIAYEARSTAAPCVQGYNAMQSRIAAIAHDSYDLISQLEPRWRDR